VKTPKRAALSRERILRCALGIVDRYGLEAISMRRVGEELGVEAMSLYNHVANKAAILDGIFETILGELPVAKLSASWSTALRRRASALRAVLRSHPNALPIFATRPAVTPASIVHVEGVLELLSSAGFSADDSLSTLQVLWAFVVGHTVNSHSPSRADDSRPAYDRLSEAEFPRVREAAQLLAIHDVEQEFELGLDVMLDGLAKRLERRGKARPR
jgi:TetR/AcrR family transcriptional regulator, tetracycline repressor protein